MKIEKDEGGLWCTEVQGSRYCFQRWGAEEALDVLVDITTVVGGPMGAVVASLFGNKEQLNQEVTADVAAQVMREMGAHLSTHKTIVMRVLQRLTGKGVLCDGKRVVFDDHYQVRLGLMFAVAKAAFEVQYGNLFGDALAASGLRLKPAGDTTPDPSTPDGKSGSSS